MENVLWMFLKIKFKIQKIKLISVSLNMQNFSFFILRNFYMHKYY